jgi:hypothetical protein
MPERKQPRRTASSAAENTGRAIGTRKIECLQKREQAAEYVTACESQKGALGLDRILSKEKNRRDEIGKANDRLNNRNKNVDPRRLYARERLIMANTTDKRITIPNAMPRCCALAGMLAIRAGASLPSS